MSVFVRIFVTNIFYKFYIKKVIIIIVVVVVVVVVVSIRGYARISQLYRYITKNINTFTFTLLEYFPFPATLYSPATCCQPVFNYVLHYN